MQDTKKPCQPIPTVHVESFVLELNHDRILAMVAIDDEEECKIFSINQSDFETWADDNDLRSWDYSRPGENDAPDEEVEGEFSWAEIYGGYSEMQRLLTDYITFVYSLENEMV